MTAGDIRIRLLVDNAKGATGPQSQSGLSFWIETPAAQVRIRELAGAEDPYCDLKQRATEVARRPLPGLATKAQSTAGPLDATLPPCLHQECAGARRHVRRRTP